MKALNYLLRFGYPLFQNVFPYQVYAYLAVGALNTALNILLFAILFQFVIPSPGVTIGTFLFASYTISLILSFLATVPTGFWLAKNFAFQSVSHNKKENGVKLFKYFLVVSQGLISDYILLKILVEWVEIYPTVAKVISTLIVLVVNYILQKYFTFKQPK